MFPLSTPIENLPKVGPKYLKKLYKLGIKNIEDLFLYFPFRYNDFRNITPINRLEAEQTTTVCGKITDIKLIRTWHKKMTLIEAVIEDESGLIKAVWFNQPYLIQSLAKGKIVNLSGKIILKNNQLQISNPIYEIIGYQKNTTHTGRLVPIYHETIGITSRYLRYLIKPLLPLIDQMQDYLPEAIRKKFNLVAFNQAVRQIHFPENKEEIEKARQRIAFDELFFIQLAVLKQKQKLRKEKAPQIAFDKHLIKNFVKSLNFELTNDQRVAAWEILQDIAKNRPANRLLNGDVGCGKTIVSAIAILQTTKAGYQTALMAPTEILASQHFKTFKKLFKKQNLNIALLTGSEKQKNKAEIKKQILRGKINLVVGTHALIQKDVQFKNLALAVIDEQHRFGVNQRAALLNQIDQKDGLATMPHLLSMTATPIPRTLALTIYGDLDISLIRQMPKGRRKITTKIITPDKYQKTYDFIVSKLKQKKQAFVICPLIKKQDPSLRSEQTSSLNLEQVAFEFTPEEEVRSVEKEYEKLSKTIFPNFKIAKLHGKLKSKEKQKIIKDFQDGKTDVLVSTSVIEVGVDMPNAAIMIIEDAYRFGLAQLHQFRGRIGRGKHKSYCFLFTSDDKKDNTRLKALLAAKDGFELAEKDLKMRGPGSLAGIKQWGVCEFTISSFNNIELIKKSRQAAKEILSKNLFTPVLKQKLSRLEANIHLE